MTFDPHTGCVTYDRDDMTSIQHAMQDMKDSAFEEGRNREVENLLELAAFCG